MSSSPGDRLPLLGSRVSLTVDETAQAMGISERKLREILPQIPHIRVGTRVLVPVKPLERWLADKAAQLGHAENATVDEIVDSFRDAETGVGKGEHPTN